MDGESFWEHFDHEADVGVRGVGPTPARAFEQAALAMSAAVSSLESINPEQPVRIQREDDDLEVLLVDWLNAVIYEMATRGMIFGRYDVAIENGRLSATAWGEAVDVRRHEPAVEVKGATYTSLHVGRSSDGAWTAQTVVDV